jgi:hypothetical protein
MFCRSGGGAAVLKSYLDILWPFLQDLSRALPLLLYTLTPRGYKKEEQRILYGFLAVPFQTTCKLRVNGKNIVIHIFHIFAVLIGSFGRACTHPAF